jgi:hypothetical protein
MDDDEPINRIQVRITALYKLQLNCFLSIPTLRLVQARAHTYSLQVVVRVRPILPHESAADVAVTTSPDGSSVQVGRPTKWAGVVASSKITKLYHRNITPLLPVHSTLLRHWQLPCLHAAQAHWLPDQSHERSELIATPMMDHLCPRYALLSGSTPSLRW